VAKAKETARLAEKIITLGKRGDAWARMTARGFLFKPDITIPLLFNEYAPRYASRPGGYTRVHLYGNRRGDNAPHAVIELVDGPCDLRFDMTARAVGRETVEAALGGHVGEFSHPDGISGSSASSQQRNSEVPLRDVTRRNLEKVLRYRSEEDKQRFRQLAADWANRLLSEPKSVGGLRHPVEKTHINPQDEKQSEQAVDQPIQQRYKYPVVVPGGKQVLLAGERLLGIQPNKESSPLATARGKLGSPRTQTRSAHF